MSKNRQTFAAIVANARKTTPGGFLNTADREGLLRRARNLELSPAEASEILDAERPRHPITRGIE